MAGKPRWWWSRGHKDLYAQAVALQTANRRVQQRYDGASSAARLRSWYSSGNSGNAEVQGGLAKLQQRSRELMQNEWRAKSAVRAVTRGIAGSSIRPLPNITDQEKAKAIKRAWSIHKSEARTSSDSTWDTTVNQAVQSMVVDGECFLRARLRRPEDGLFIPLQWQLLESDMLDVTFDQDLGAAGRIIQGIQFDKVGRRTFYHFWKRHPGDNTAFGQSNGSERVPVPAGEVIHLWNQAEARAGQVRGVPWTHAVMVAIHEVGITEDALRVGLQNSTMLSGAITSPDQDALQSLAPVDEAGPDANGTTMLELDPGIINRLNPGEQIEFQEVKAPSGVTEYLNSGDHGIAQGVGSTYEEMTGDLSRVNYSAGRMGRSNTRAYYRMIRDNVVIPQMCMIAWKWFIRIGKLAREIPLDYDYRDVRWVASSEEGIDPVKDAKAASSRLGSGLTTLEDEIEAAGGDYYATIDRAKRVDSDLEERELKYDWVIDVSEPSPAE